MLKIIAALITLAFGLYCIYQPNGVARASHFRLEDGRGRTEFRIAFGGFFAGFGIAALLLNDPVAYQLLGAGWLGGAAIRVIGLLMENQPKKIIDRSYFVLGVVETSVGLILIL